jgi:uncharacterized protein
MAFKINDIPPEGLTVRLADKLDLFEEGTATTPFKATVSFKAEGAGIFHVNGTVEATTELECSRCLKRFSFPVREASMDFELVPEGSMGQAAEHELGRGELDTEFYRGEEIEPKEFIREQLLLGIPMVPVHNPDCKGLCPVCGADRNETTCGCRIEAIEGGTSPFAVLKKIIKPEKE